MGESQINADMVKPTEHRVLIRRSLKAEKTTGGIYLPEQSREISQTGTVVRCADDVTTMKRDDVVIFSSYAASPCVAVQGEEADLLFVRERDILAVVEDAD